MRIIETENYRQIVSGKGLWIQQKLYSLGLSLTALLSTWGIPLQQPIPTSLPEMEQVLQTVSNSVDEDDKKVKIRAYMDYLWQLKRKELSGQ